MPLWNPDPRRMMGWRNQPTTVVFLKMHWQLVWGRRVTRFTRMSPFGLDIWRQAKGKPVMFLKMADAPFWRLGLWQAKGKLTTSLGVPLACASPGVGPRAGAVGAVAVGETGCGVGVLLAAGFPPIKGGGPPKLGPQEWL